MHRRISSGLGLGIIIILAIIVGGVFVFYGKDNSNSDDLERIEKNINEKDSTNLNKSDDESKKDLSEGAEIALFVNKRRIVVDRPLLYPQGQEIELFFDVNSVEPMDLSDIEIIVTGTNEGALEISQENSSHNSQYSSNSTRSFRYKASYIAKNDGIDTIDLFVGSNKEGSYKIIFYNNNFLVPSSLNINQVSFESIDSLNLDEKKNNEAIKIKEGGWFESVMPGHIKYSFSNPKNEGKATLALYTISPAIEKFENLPYYDELPHEPVYIENFYKLEKALASKSSVAKDAKLALFPPANAVCVGPTRLRYFESEEFIGVSYMIYGCYQGVDIADDIKYVFQGITRDKKYHIVFTYHEIVVDELEEFKNELDNKTESDYVENSKKSFDLLSELKEDDFSPSQKELDDMMKSIKIK